MSKYESSAQSTNDSHCKTFYSSWHYATVVYLMNGKSSST